MNIIEWILWAVATRIACAGVGDEALLDACHWINFQGWCSAQQPAKYPDTLFSSMKRHAHA